MSNSTLVTYTKISPNRTSPRNHAIDTITIHCFVGQVTAESGCNAKNFVTYDPVNGASCNYVVGYDGSIGLCVDEADRSWCSSNRDNDHRAITIEVACETSHPYNVTVKAYDALIKLVADICKRNGIKKLLWKADKSLIGQVDKQNMTVHRWFANKSCPGEYLYNQHGDIAKKVNILLGSETEEYVPTVLEWQKAAIADGFAFPKYGADGYWGAECESVAKKAVVKKRTIKNKPDYKYKNLTKIVQKVVKVEADGLCGNATDTAIREYQRKNNLTADGCVGLKTWKKMLHI